MIRTAVQSDIPALESFLSERIETSMFLMSNMRQFGVTGGEHRNATRFVLEETSDGITQVAGLTTIGNLLLQATQAGTVFWSELADWIDDRPIAGLIGPAEQVTAARAAFGLHDRACQMDDIEPLYALDLYNLILPRGKGEIIQPDMSHHALLSDWRRAYHIETLGSKTGYALEEAVAQEVANMIATGSHRLLVSDNQFLSMSGFNARLPEAVQIGGVYTPPDLRGQGYARRAVALYLREAQQSDVKRAILFSAGPAANRAYEAIGFGRIGEYALTLFSEPERLRP